VDKKGGHFLRELIRILVRDLGILEKGDAACCGTTIAQCHAIVEIGRNGEISLSELSEVLNLDNSTMSRTINNLVSQNLVTREEHAGDRRYLVIRLTEEGSKIYQVIEGSMDKYYNSILSSIPEDKRDQVLESIEILISAVKQNKCC
jgi:DNA-binding MarR family transcriptional regulator